MRAAGAARSGLPSRGRPGLALHVLPRLHGEERRIERALIIRCALAFVWLMLLIGMAYLFTRHS